MGWDGLAYKSHWLRDHLLLVARSDHTTRSRNIKLEIHVVFKVQKMARYAPFCLIMGPFKGEVHVFARLSPVRVRVSFTTGAVRSAILATAGLLVTACSAAWSRDLYDEPKSLVHGDISAEKLRWICVVLTESVT